CADSFNLYAAPASVKAAENVLVDYLRRNCPRHVACFGADETAIRGHCGQCAEAYSVLGLREGESNRQIKSAYRELARKWHPDTVSATNERLRDESVDHFIEISSAYKHLN